ncbi:MAG: CPBP family intramembrane metalloprotease [Ruminococcaceae bacterium]|nr:CPBP family intramembrane metalloprotease [Oscillospiraceae bacterium]
MRALFNKKRGSDELDEIIPKQRKNVIITPSTLVLAVYVLLLLTKILDVAFINRENEYYSVVILQLMIFMLPGAIWCKWSGENYVKGLRLRLPKPSSFLLILSGALLMISGALLLSTVFNGLESLSSNFSLYDTFISKTDGSVSSGLYLFVAYAILPAICEEFVFRGILCYEYENGGVFRAIAFSSLFFALLHFNPINILVYLFSGIVLSLVLYASRSLIGAMLAHFLYNVFGLFGQRYMNTLYRITGSSSFFIFIVTFCFLLSGAVFCRQAAKLYKKYLYDGVSSNYRKPDLKTPEQKRASYISVIKEPSTIACGIFYVVASIIYLF